MFAFISTAHEIASLRDISKILFLSDSETPRVRDCPQSFEVQLLPGESSRTVSWAEPIFTDNVGVDRIYKSKVNLISSSLREPKRY